jgi:hypothetical protein
MKKYLEHNYFSCSFMSTHRKAKNLKKYEPENTWENF